MAYTSEIEKLERRWLENPKGRNFAPLADAYRKAGELDRAVDLCKNGLELHPDYVSAYIVYGRCLIDKKDDPGAEEVFRKVLALDQENVLSLRILAEIADRTRRFDQEVDWLTRLLAADPMNGDAAELLARAKVKAASVKTAAPPPAVEPVAVQLEDPTPVPMGMEPTALADAPTAAMDKPDFVLERASQPGMAAPPEAARPPTAPPLPPGELEVYDGTVDFNAAANAAARADGIELQEEVDLKVDAAPLEGLARTQYEGSGMFKGPPEVEEDLPSVDLPLIMPDDIPPARFPELEAEPVAATPSAAPRPAPPPPPPPPAAPPSPPRRDSGAGRSRPPAAVALSDDDGAADTAALSQAEPVLTETMADLFLRQGHREEALRVYQALLTQRPGDGRLQAKVNELSGRAGARRAAARSGGQSAGAYLKSVLGGKTPVAARSPAPRPAPAEPPPSSRPLAPPEPTATLDEAFGEEAGMGEPPPGSPTRPADDSISLDSVFGDARDSMQQFPPAEEPPPSAPGAGPSGAPAGGFSFDDFFNAAPPAPGGGQAAPAGHPEKAPARPSGRQSRPAEEDVDLDQFQTWLKGLKS